MAGRQIEFPRLEMMACKAIELFLINATNIPSSDFSWESLLILLSGESLSQAASVMSFHGRKMLRMI